ncbi:MAG: hypothetical protein CMF74_04390 [Maricaulis sp.]|jgi:hypothetical protein|nr:hypothetical protein [Maricaulis sp.]HAQ33757.1 DUF3089 domain-containing protein [Alphaproteobacteria bacterium]
MAMFRKRRLSGLARWLILGAIVLFAILFALAAWISRHQIYQSFLDPGEPFQTYSPPAEPNYADADAWHLVPAPSGEEPAVFFVHGTTFAGGSEWNAPIDDADAAEAVTGVEIPNYAGPFREIGPVFAPRYRQAALYTFMNNREDSVLARELAAADVLNAFDAFLLRIGEDRPFVIAGAGQGGIHALHVLTRRVAPSDDLRSRLIAAYLMETPVALELFTERLASLPPCQTPESIRCVLAYDSARPEEADRIRIITERSQTWSPNGRLALTLGRGLLCVNPILGAVSTDFAPARLHRGGAVAEGIEEDTLPPILTGQTGAQCVDGVLMTEQPSSPSLRRPDRLGETFRIPPFNLFYEDLRFDAAHRTERLIATLSEERLYAPPFDAPEEVDDAPVRPVEGG